MGARAGEYRPARLRFADHGREEGVSEYEIAMHTARVCLGEARARRATSPRLADTMLQWAANARRRAMAAKVTSAPAQGDLFGSAK